MFFSGRKAVSLFMRERLPHGIHPDQAVHELKKRPDVYFQDDPEEFIHAWPVYERIAVLSAIPQKDQRSAMLLTAAAQLPGERIPPDIFIGILKRKQKICCSFHYGRHGDR